MRLFALALLTTAVLSTPAAAMDARLERVLKMLDPAERLAQLCDYTAMSAIKKDSHDYRPDRAVANARQQPLIRGDSIEARGAAFRSRNKWYALSYSCSADGDHMNVRSFKYKIGEEIPASKWTAYNLFD